jgi:hypothetical protein
MTAAKINNNSSIRLTLKLWKPLGRSPEGCCKLWVSANLQNTTFLMVCANFSCEIYKLSLPINIIDCNNEQFVIKFRYKYGSMYIFHKCCSLPNSSPRTSFGLCETNSCKKTPNVYVYILYSTPWLGLVAWSCNPATRKSRIVDSYRRLRI